MTRDILRRPSGKPQRIIHYKHDENFENLVFNWKRLKNNLVLFLGAGASSAAKNRHGEYLPSAYELRNELWSNFILTDKERGHYDFSNLSLMSLEHAATLVEIKTNRKILESFIADRFEVKDSMWQHQVLPYLKPKSIFTTNYDNLIEKGFAKTNYGKALTTVFHHKSEINQNYLPLYKPHGSVEFPHAKVSKGGLVITQFDYYEIMDARREMLETFLSDFPNCCVIFIGYSFFDFDISSILYKLSGKNKANSWYAVFPRNDADVRNMLRDRYGIKQINLDFKNFIYWLDHNVNFIPKSMKLNGQGRKK